MNNNKDNKDNEIDKLLEGIYDDSYDQDSEDDQDELDNDETLAEAEEIIDDVDETLRDAKKFLSLMEEFDIKDGSNMEANLQKNKKEIIESRVKLQTQDETIKLTSSIIESNELLEDFILVRETLREDIKNTRIVLSKLSEDLGSISAEDLNGQVVLAFSDMKKSNVKSMELLINSYEKVAQTQLSVKKLTQELKVQESREEQENGSDGAHIDNAIFVGDAAQLLESLKKN